MSVQGGGSISLTSKFSRSSLKRATGHSHTSKEPSREEELAKATNKRFNSDSWRKVSKNYRAFPTSHHGLTQGGSFCNTQILNTMSSLTNDEAFLKSSSSMRGESLLSRSASFSGGNYTSTGNPHIFRKPNQPFMNPSQRSNRSDATPETSPASSSSFSSHHDVDEFQDCQTNQVTPPSAPSTPSLPRTNLPSRFNPSPRRPSLRGAAGSVPKLSRRLSGRSIVSRSSEINISKPKAGTKTYQQLKTEREAFMKTRKIGSIQTFFAKIFKLFHYLVLLPNTIKAYLTRPKWSAKGKNILITGASSGIGAELARQYAAQGARLALFARTEKDLERVADECRELGSSKALYYSTDLSNPVSTKLGMKQAMADFANFDVVILNAGRAHGCYFEEIKDVSQIEAMIKLNVNGVITCLHYVLPHVPKTCSSRIVVVSNTAGIVAAPYQSVYSATKHALTGFSNSLRLELKNTYGYDSPKVCLVNFPEVSGTRCNGNRMDMGARLPPAKWYSWAGMPLPHAVHDLIPAVAAGRREYGQPLKFNVWRSLYSVCPDWVDNRVLKQIQKTHYRPLDERCKTQQPSMKQESASSEKNKAPPNKSWAC